jgi:hypothetical protein
VSLVRRFLDATFVLGEGDFGEAGSNTITLSNLRITAHVENAGGRSAGTMSTTIFGMTLSQMNTLSTLGLRASAFRKNSITLKAFDQGGVPAVVFQGTITDAFGDFGRAPDVGFQVQAHTGGFEAVKPATPVSISGSADVASIMSSIATQAGWTFENNGVTAKLSNAYFAGSLLDQAREVVEHAGIMWNGAEKGHLAIWPPNGSRGGAIPLLSPASGLIGYPAYNSNGLMLRTVFNPSVGLGSRVQVQSSLGVNSKLPATGTWIVYKIDHHLESQVINGHWESTLFVLQPGTGPAVA